ncbi:hypothetical protein ABEG17_05130 [Pedococcus sp. KACC 23699]|uniref:Secreted protein n=1 Tax=Pedococcus sp. KACC 23699 TaxID=3149228 RepID=A0AAU7JXD5_9MICO
MSFSLLLHVVLAASMIRVEPSDFVKQALITPFAAGIDACATAGIPPRRASAVPPPRRILLFFDFSRPDLRSLRVDMRSVS